MEFEDTFIEVCNEVQKGMDGQMHFSSVPLVYKFEVNREGVKVAELKRNDADRMVNEWAERTAQKRDTELNQSDCVEKIKAECGFNEVWFKELQKGYKTGVLSIQNNVTAKAYEIKALEVEMNSSNVCTMPSIGSNEYKGLFTEGIEILKEPIAYVILNGGESTRFGVNTVRGLNPAFYVSGKHCSMIELKMRHLSFLYKKYKSPVYAVLVNSFFTNKHTMKLLESKDFLGLPGENVYSCLHKVSYRVYPKERDLDYWHEVLREKGLTENEEQLSKQYLESMKNWVNENGEGNIYKPTGVNKINTLVSPGHFYSFMSIVSDYTLGRLIEKGVKRIIVSSNDNLLSTIDPAILAFHVANNYGATAEVVPRLYDRGGAPALVNGKVVILEDFSFPDKETLWGIPFFNPITTWIEVDSLLNLLELRGNDLIEASRGNPEMCLKCNKAVETLAGKVKSYVVLKHLSEDLGNGITNVFPVVQFEKLFGDLVGLLNPMFLLVPKVLRHTQMKSVDNVYQIIVERALDVLKPQLKIL